jgi:fucose permease
MAAALGIPVAIGAATAAGIAWRLLFLVPVGVLALLSAATSARPPRDVREVERNQASGPIPRAFWLAWAFVLLGVAIEFSVVFWASTLVATRTGVSLAAAVSLGALFLLGMLAGRAAVAAGMARHVTSARLLAIGLALAAAGALLIWLTAEPALAGVGLFLAGLGTGMFYPVGVTVAMAQAPDAPVVASTRLALASGAAILTAPLVLGLIADAVGVVAGWLLVPLLAGAALVVLATIPARPGRSVSVAEARPGVQA